MKHLTCTLQNIYIQPDYLVSSIDEYSPSANRISDTEHLLFRSSTSILVSSFVILSFHNSSILETNWIHKASIVCAARCVYVDFYSKSSLIIRMKYHFVPKGHYFRKYLKMKEFFQNIRNMFCIVVVTLFYIVLAAIIVWL